MSYYQPYQMYMAVQGLPQTPYAQPFLPPAYNNGRGFVQAYQVPVQPTLIANQQTMQPYQISNSQPPSSFQNLNSNFKQKIMVISQMLQISEEEVKQLLSDNICICCKNQLDMNSKQNFENLPAENQQFQDKIVDLSASSPREIDQQSYHNQHNEKKINKIKQKNLISISEQVQDNNSLQNQISQNQSPHLHTHASQQKDSSQFIRNNSGRNYQEQDDEERLNNIKYKGSSYQKSQSTNQQNSITNQYNRKMQLKSGISSKHIHKPLKYSLKINKQRPLTYESDSHQLDSNDNPIKVTKMAKFQSKENQIQETKKENTNLCYQIPIQSSKQDTSKIQEGINSEDSFAKTNQAPKFMCKQSHSFHSDEVDENDDIDELGNSQEFIGSDQSYKQPKEIQNNSNYTKNFLKGFLRVMIKNYGSNTKFISEFKNYFHTFSLNNEFILRLFTNSPYSDYFQEFLQTDPSWWMKEARIKDTDHQLKFFKICQRRQLSLIRTKRKKFVRPEKI